MEKHQDQLPCLCTKRLMKVEEVADLLSLSRSKVYELIGEGRLQTVKIGRSLRIENTEVERFIGVHRVS